MGVRLLAANAMRFARVRLGVVPGHVSAIRHQCRIERGTSGDRLQRQLLECTTVSGCNYAGKRDEERQQSGDPLPTTSPEVGSHGNPMIPAYEESRMIQVNPMSGGGAMCRTDRHRGACHARRNLSALPTTDTELNDIAAAAKRGDSRMPRNG